MKLLSRLLNRGIDRPMSLPQSELQGGASIGGTFSDEKVAPGKFDAGGWMERFLAGLPEEQRKYGMESVLKNGYLHTTFRVTLTQGDEREKAREFNYKLMEFYREGWECVQRAKDKLDFGSHCLIQEVEVRRPLTERELLQWSSFQHKVAK